MRSRVVRVSLAVAVAALAVTAGASSRPAAGISVRAFPVIVSLKGFDYYSGVATLAYTTAARWNPEASQEEVTVTFHNVTERVVERANTPPCCNRLHSHNRYTELASGFAGHKLEITATWKVYNVGGDSGEHTSPKTTYEVPTKEQAPRLQDLPKNMAKLLAFANFSAGAWCIGAAAAGVAVLGAPLLVAIGLAGAIFVGVGLYETKQAFDPVDMNFRSIAKPKIPSVPKVSPGEGLPEAAARMLNSLFAVQAREIGFGRAIAIAFDRSQGAHVKKATAWEKRQVRASGIYAAQFANALRAEASLWPKVKAALAESALADVDVAYEDALAFGESLVSQGIPAAMAANLTKLGLTKAEQKEVRAQLATIDPGLYDGAVLDALPGAKDIANMRKLAAGLKAFAKKAAKTPLATRPP